MTGSPSTPRVLSDMARTAGGGVITVLGSEAPEPGNSHCLGDATVPDPPPSRQGTIAMNEWPLRTFLELGALPTAVPCIRLHVRRVLWEWTVADELRENSEQVVSELAGNAVSASRAIGHASIRLWLLSDRTRVLLLVADASPQRPIRIDADVEAENGRGLLLVEAISAQWGWYFPDDGTEGKLTWALIQAELQ